MELFHLLFITIQTLVIYTSLVHAQQTYIGVDPEIACNSDTENAIFRGYTGNGKTSCDAVLTFRSQDPYNTLSSIASLLEVEYNELAKANPNYTVDVVAWNKLVHVPITCEREDRLEYRKLINYVVQPGEDDIFYIANNTFQGLTTCQAIIAANGDNTTISNGTDIFIRLRCACPTNNQHNAGVDSLLTYVVGNGDTISSISKQLNVDSKSIREANDLVSEDSIIYPFTTLLIPVMNNNNSTNEPASRTLSKGAIGGIAAAACAALLAFGGAAIKFNLCGSIFTCCNSTNHFHNKETEEGKTGDKTKPHDQRVYPVGNATPL